jgi:MOSC domain-containing protein YiiM
MKLLSINIGSVRVINIASDSQKTGIYKMPVDASVRITQEGLEADTICDKKNHGGPDQAVYVYGSADYDWWSAELGRELRPGTFGENLTISDLESAPFHIGDRLHIGSVILEVTAPRIPCVKFATKMEIPDWVKRFRRGERPGLYCRVIQPGEVHVGDPVTLDTSHRSDVTILDLYHLFYDNHASEAAIRHVLAAPIDIRARRDYEERLEALQAIQR